MLFFIWIEVANRCLWPGITTLLLNLLLHYHRVNLLIPLLLHHCLINVLILHGVILLLRMALILRTNHTISGVSGRSTTIWTSPGLSGNSGVPSASGEDSLCAGAGAAGGGYAWCNGKACWWVSIVSPLCSNSSFNSNSEVMVAESLRPRT